MERFTYLGLEILTVLFPLVLAFKGPHAFYKSWGALAIALPSVASVFLMWDYFFTRWGVWSFDERYVVGTSLLGLPLEEILFFFAIPFACMFIYENVRCRLPPRASNPKLAAAALLAAALMVGAGLIFWDQLYTRVSLLSAGVALAVAARRPYLEAFSYAFGLHLAPFLLVNGVLTYLPVVRYHGTEITGFRIGSIPIEDLFYSLLLFLGNVHLREALASPRPLYEEGVLIQRGNC